MAGSVASPDFTSEPSPASASPASASPAAAPSAGTGLYRQAGPGCGVLLLSNAGAASCCVADGAAAQLGSSRLLTAHPRLHRHQKTFLPFHLLPSLQPATTVASLRAAAGAADRHCAAAVLRWPPTGPFHTTPATGTPRVGAALAEQRLADRQAVMV